MKDSKMRFDEMAEAWDNDPKKVERAKIFAGEITAFIKPSGKLNALEFGCGTGLLSFELKDSFEKITLVDTSEGMIAVLKDKIRAAGIKNFEPLLIDLHEVEINIPQQDVVYTSMTLHHVADTGMILNTFNSMLNPGGYLCIADLVTEDGSFHAHISDFEGHNGFDRAELTEQLQKSGFAVEYYNVCFEIEKETDNVMKKYPVFLMISKKTSN